VTALKGLERLEAEGAFAPSPDAVAEPVLVQFGESALTILRFDETPIDHWPLASLRRLAREDGAVTLSPDHDAPERLRIADADMIAAIETVSRGLTAPPRRMNAPSPIRRRPSVCPHDCPSTCALDVEVLDGGRIGRVRGAKDQSYTDGVICAKVARYAERVHHPDRLTHPMRRKGAKGEGRFAPISWDEALDETAERFRAAATAHGAEAVWPYYYAGTMGLVMRDGINRLRHAMGYSGQFNTICTTHGLDRLRRRNRPPRGRDPREMAKAIAW
jgi:hypothetical protein